MSQGRWITRAVGLGTRLSRINWNSYCSSTRSGSFRSSVRSDASNSINNRNSNIIPNIPRLNGAKLVSRRDNSTLSTLLKSSHFDIMKSQREALNSLQSIIQTSDSYSPEDIDLIIDTKTRIDDLFMVVVVGEFNAGKSTFLNSILGAKYLKEGVLPTTSKICILRHLDESNSDSATDSGVWKKTSHLKLEDVEEMGLPLEWLRHIAVVDTPGTNVIVEKHEELTQKIIPRSDLVLFVTSAERPISESESIFLQKIAQWGKKVIVVVNKMDIVQSEADKKAIVEYVSQNCASILGSSTKAIPVFPVSGRNALSAKLSHLGKDPLLGPGAKQWQESNMAALEDHLRQVLGKDELIKSKISSSLMVMDRLVSVTLSTTEANAQALESDMHILKMIDDNMGLFRTDLENDVKQFRQMSNSLLDQRIERLDRFFDNEVSVMKPDLLLNPSNFIDRLRTDVIIDLAKPLRDVVKDVSDAITVRSRSQAKSVIDFVGDRPRRYKEIMIGSVQERQFEKLRSEFTDRLLRDINAELIAHEKSLAADLSSISSSLKSAWIQTAVVSGSCLAGIASMSYVNMYDTLGLGLHIGVAVEASLAVVMAIGINSILPRRRAALKKELKDKIGHLKTLLEKVISNHVTHEISFISERISDTISPYSRHIRSRVSKCGEAKVKLLELRAQVHAIKQRANEC